MEFTKVTIVAGCVSGAALFGATEAMAMPINGITVNQAGGIGTVPAGLPPIGISPLGLSNPITYFIPLSSAPATCTYGDGCGTSPDTGSGGTAMSMFLEFGPVTPLLGGVLTIQFDDLDLKNANDPYGFFESIRIFDSNSAALTPLISDILLSALITAPAPAADNITTLTLPIDASLVVSNPFYVELVFRAQYDYYGKNTAEYMTATFWQESGPVSEVPVPAALPLFGTGLGIMGFIGWRRKRRMAAEARPD